MADKDLTDEQILAKVRYGLLDKYPFFGTLIMELVPVKVTKEKAGKVWGNHAPTLATDGTHLYWSPEYLRRIDADERLFGLAHEVLHCAFHHCSKSRVKHRDREKTGIAQDLVINPILVEDGLKMPVGPKCDQKSGKHDKDTCKCVLYVPKFKGLSYEEIYNRIKVVKRYEDGDCPGCDGSNNDGSNKGQGKGKGRGCPNCGGDPSGDPSAGPGDGGTFDIYDGKEKVASGNSLGPCANGDQSKEDGDDNKEGGCPKGPSEAELEQKWRQAVARAYETARQAGKLPAGFGRFVDDLLNPSMDWKSVLAEFIQPAANDYSWLPPDRRITAFFFPALNGETVEGIVVGVDTSGSITQEDLKDFFSELMGIVNSYPAIQGHMVSCDAEVHEGGWCEFNEGTTTKELMDHVKGGGGTSFIPVFDFVTSHQLRPACLIFFTDAEGSYPTQEPDYPVLWVVKGGAWDRPPFGRKVQYTRDERQEW